MRCHRRRRQRDKLASPMALQNWVDLETIQAICKHCSAVVVAIVGFAVVGGVIYWAMPEGVLKRAVELVDGFILLCLVGILGLKLLNLTYRGTGFGPLVA